MPHTCHQCINRSATIVALPDGRRFAYCLRCAVRIYYRYGKPGPFHTGPDNTITLPA